MFKEENIRDHLQRENNKLKFELEEKEEKIATMATLSKEAIHCRHSSKTYFLLGVNVC